MRAFSSVYKWRTPNWHICLYVRIRHLKRQTGSRPRTARRIAAGEELLMDYGTDFTFYGENLADTK
jgi:hypothetical protein